MQWCEHPHQRRVFPLAACTPRRAHAAQQNAEQCGPPGRHAAYVRATQQHMVPGKPYPVAFRDPTAVLDGCVEVLCVACNCSMV